MSPIIRLFLVAAVSAVLGAALGVSAALHVVRDRIVTPRVVSTAQPELGAIYTPVDVNALPGWSEDAVSQAFSALKQTCARLRAVADDTMIGAGTIARPARAWHEACDAVNATQEGDAPFRATLDHVFEPYRVSATWTRSQNSDPQTKDPEAKDQGLFTGYYEADLNGSLVQTGTYKVPIYGLPRNLVTVDLKDFFASTNPLPNGVPTTLVGRIDVTSSGQNNLKPYYTRAEIDRDDAIADVADVLLWADDPVAVHILHIQGSGRVTLPDGRIVRLAFAGHNGHAFRGIGAILNEAGVLRPGQTSMMAIRDWLQAHADQARDYMNRNTRYIFFREIQAAGTDGPLGAMGIALTPGRSLAVDPRFVPLGAPVWLDIKDPDGVVLQRLVVAEDVGSAITGPVRGDFFWGHGENAFSKAGRMHADGRYFIFIPRWPASGA